LPEAAAHNGSGWKCKRCGALDEPGLTHDEPPGVYRGRFAASPPAPPAFRLQG
jgi:hypothetical protein